VLNVQDLRAREREERERARERGREYRVDKGLGDGDLLDARHVEAVHVVPEMDLLVLLWRFG